MVADFVELFGGDEAGDGELFFGRLEVLAEGQHVAADGSQVGGDVEDFVTLFAEAEHEARLGDHVGGFVFDLLEQVERALVGGVAANDFVEPWNRFGVVVVNVGLGFDDAADGLAAAAEVGGEHFDGGSCFLADGDDRFVEVFGSAIGEVVAGDAGDDDVFQAETQGGFGDAFWLINFDGLGLAAVDGAEAAGASADRAENHEGGRLVRPALGAVGALARLANGFEAEVFDDVRRVGHVAGRHRSLEPLRQASTHAAAVGGFGFLVLVSDGDFEIERHGGHAAGPGGR